MAQHKVPIEQLGPSLPALEIDQDVVRFGPMQEVVEDSGVQLTRDIYQRSPTPLTSKFSINPDVMDQPCAGIDLAAPDGRDGPSTLLDDHMLAAGGRRLAPRANEALFQITTLPLVREQLDIARPAQCLPCSQATGFATLQRARVRPSKHEPAPALAIGRSSKRNQFDPVAMPTIRQQPVRSDGAPSVHVLHLRQVEQFDVQRELCTQGGRQRPVRQHTEAIARHVANLRVGQVGPCNILARGQGDKTTITRVGPRRCTKAAVGDLADAHPSAPGKPGHHLPVEGLHAGWPDDRGTIGPGLKRRVPRPGARQEERICRGLDPVHTHGRGRGTPSIQVNGTPLDDGPTREQSAKASTTEGLQFTRTRGHRWRRAGAGLEQECGGGCVLMRHPDLQRLPAHVS